MHINRTSLTRYQQGNKMKTTTATNAQSPAACGWATMTTVLKCGLLALALAFGLGAYGQTITTTTNFSANTAVPDAVPSGFASPQIVSTPLAYSSGLKVSLKLTGSWIGDLYCYLT